MGEYTTSASATDVKAEFIWALPQVANDNAFGGDDGVGGYMPLAVVTRNAGGTLVVNWVHGNHLGTPVVTTDAAGNAATTPNDYQLPGFPGQSRVLADLYYNRYRDYDPTTGRYLQADPIGLDGGQNDYVYVGNNPLKAD
jgi:RHS repeat-associated protein